MGVDEGDDAAGERDARGSPVALDGATAVRSAGRTRHVCGGDKS
jgi:hypothetical protein